MQHAAAFDTSVRKSFRRVASIWPDPHFAALIVDLDEQTTIRIKPWRMTMNRPKKFVVSAATLAVLVLGSGGLSSAIAATDLTRVAMMDDDKMSKMPAPSDSSGKMNTGQPSGQPQNMSGGQMNDDKMKMPPQGQMRDCQGAGCQDNSGHDADDANDGEDDARPDEFVWQQRRDEWPGGRDRAARRADRISEGGIADQRQAGCRLE
ncbi:hypothetical protein [Bradyrhizobium diazoefficiens]|uniref:hypothetical protein n=1 Tax=Bradyrhizobium diazoefficiens TaxID=1355477 RepID=UPI002012064A|nr:hypothetical protein [Bradyrhizobium diazoefficiens]